jgi:hypothetical protein
MTDDTSTTLLVTASPLYKEALSQVEITNENISKTSHFVASFVCQDKGNVTEGNLIKYNIINIREDKCMHHTQTSENSVRVYQYYTPVMLWLQHQVELSQQSNQANTNSSKKTCVVGITFPQGGGKTTLSLCVESVMTEVVSSTFVFVQQSLFCLHFKNYLMQQQKFHQSTVQ